MKNPLLSDLVDEFAATLSSNAYSKSTTRTYLITARGFLAHVGNIQVRSVTARHVDSFFAARQSAGNAATTLNLHRSGLRALFDHAARRRYIPTDRSPVAHRRPFRVVSRDRARVPATEFPRLLDAATHPRDRIIVALGLFLFLRQSEMKALRVGDVDLDSGEVAVEVIKTKQFDRMPISAELDTEVRRWLTFYSDNVGRPLRHDDHLVPAKSPNLFVKGLAPEVNATQAKAATRLNPSRPVGQPELRVQAALAAIGVPIRDGGKSTGEGVHTLRRSGARALFDRLVQDGYDGAMRTVQSMLHHSSVATTEHYLGIQLDKKRRDGLVKGKPMFPVSTENVIRLEAVRGENAGGHGAV